ncbi:HAD family phosphatase [Mycolicibacterium sp. P1-5]|uniref:HAD family hydrolase n=1 Tax=Mycolicibacterium sp. P1-5 TaxID=2024617 RepID=UPI0011ED4DE0|nr:HAD family hydrolase [Mycolicibacterium sp. P1-5]KAA0110139.1 haloacid dehalogenase-like hydrolase [Mycolicibacterium sp. P1-5]
MLEAWTDGPAKSAIVEFAARAAETVAPEERIAVFDNDGTLWCEKPAYIQLDFLVRRIAAQVAADPELADKQPYTAAAAGDLHWFGDAVTKHYNGDHADLKLLAVAVLSANVAISTDEHAARVSAFFGDAKHPTLGRAYTACGYAPMVELLRYLESFGFVNYIVSGGGRDFMRPITTAMYGVPPERVIGSSVGLIFQNGELLTTAQPEVLNDGPVKPVRIWGRVGRRPILAAGNSNGDIEMLQYITAGTAPSLALLVRHDDADREFAYTAGAERALDLAETHGWIQASMRDDWKTVFSD